MIKNFKLTNGIRVVMEEIPFLQSVSIGIWVKAGSVDEDKDNYGISHFIEHMLFKGTTNRSAKEIAQDIDKIGGQINAFTSKESTCYYVKSLKTSVVPACDVLIDMFTNSIFDEIEIEKERRVVLEEINMVEDSPEDYTHDALYEVLFKGEPLSTPILGTKKTLHNINQSIIKKYIEDEYTCDNIVIAVAGNYDENQILEIFENKFSALKPSKKDKEITNKIYAPNFKSKAKDIEQSHICLGTIGVNLDHELYYPMAIVNNIMGGSMSSRLFQNIREEKGMAYSVYSFTSSYVNNGFYGIYAGVSHDKVDETVGAIIHELKYLEKNGVTETELKTAKEQIKGHHIFSLESVSGRMAALGKNTLLMNKVFEAEEIISSIDKVTLDDILKVSELITDIKAYSGVLLSKSKKDLQKLII